MLTRSEVCFLTSRLIEVSVPFPTPSASGGIVNASGNSVSPSLKNSGTASSIPVLTSNSSSTTSLTTPTNTNPLGLIPSAIAVGGATYVYVGCFENQYIQPITAGYTVGDVNQCGQLCLGSTYFSLEAGDECEWLPILEKECEL